MLLLLCWSSTLSSHFESIMNLASARWAVIGVITLLLLLLHLNLVPCQFVDLHTDLGRLRGVRFRTAYNSPALAFLGVPYALPPHGERRFRRPVPYPKWSPKTLMATEFKSCCPQLDLHGAPHGSEDCLHLNIFIPDGATASSSGHFGLVPKRLPVMIYIQGECVVLCANIFNICNNVVVGRRRIVREW